MSSTAAVTTKKTLLPEKSTPTSCCKKDVITSIALGILSGAATAAYCISTGMVISVSVTFGMTAAILATATVYAITCCFCRIHPGSGKTTPALSNNRAKQTRIPAQAPRSAATAAAKPTSSPTKSTANPTRTQTSAHQTPRPVATATAKSSAAKSQPQANAARVPTQTQTHARQASRSATTAAAKPPAPTKSPQANATPGNAPSTPVPTTTSVQHRVQQVAATSTPKESTPAKTTPITSLSKKEIQVVAKQITTAKVPTPPSNQPPVAPNPVAVATGLTSTPVLKQALPEKSASKEKEPESSSNETENYSRDSDTVYVDTSKSHKPAADWKETVTRFENSEPSEDEDTVDLGTSSDTPAFMKESADAIDVTEDVNADLYDAEGKLLNATDVHMIGKFKAAISRLTANNEKNEKGLKQIKLLSKGYRRSTAAYADFYIENIVNHKVISEDQKLSLIKTILCEDNQPIKFPVSSNVLFNILNQLITSLPKGLPVVLKNNLSQAEIQQLSSPFENIVSASDLNKHPELVEPHHELYKLSLLLCACIYASEHEPNDVTLRNLKNRILESPHVVELLHLVEGEYKPSSRHKAPRAIRSLVEFRQRLVQLTTDKPVNRETMQTKSLQARECLQVIHHLLRHKYKLTSEDLFDLMHHNALKDFTDYICSSNEDKDIVNDNRKIFTTLFALNILSDPLSESEQKIKNASSFVNVSRYTTVFNLPLEAAEIALAFSRVFITSEKTSSEGPKKTHKHRIALKTKIAKWCKANANSLEKSNNRHKHGNAPLHQAVLAGNDLGVLFLLNLGFSSLEINDKGNTPAQLAIQQKNPLIVQDIFKAICDRNQTAQILGMQNNAGNNSLHLGMQTDLPTAQALLKVIRSHVQQLISKAKSNPSAAATILHEIDQIITALTIPNYEGNTPLLLATTHSPKMVQLLLQLAKDLQQSVNLLKTENNNSTPINLLAQMAQAENKEGHRPLQLAAMSYSPASMSMLLHAQAPLFSDDCDKFKEWAKKKKFDVNMRVDDNGNRFLHYAARKKSPLFMDFLLYMGADPNIQNAAPQHSNAAPLFKFTETKDKKIEIACSPELKRDYAEPLERTPLHIVVAQGNEPMFYRLLNCNPNLNIQDCKGNTALHTALLLEKAKLAAALIQKKAATNIKNKLGMTSLELIIGDGNQYLFGLLPKEVRESKKCKELMVKYEFNPMVQPITIASQSK